MRSQFVGESNSIYYFSVEWSPNQVSWADFRGKMVGPTDPDQAPPDSIRGTIAAKWKNLDLKGLVPKARMACMLLHRLWKAWRKKPTGFPAQSLMTLSGNFFLMEELARL